MITFLLVGRARAQGGVCIYVLCVYIRMCVWMYVCVCIYVYIHICMYIRIHAYMCIYIYMSVYQAVPAHRALYMATMNVAKTLDVDDSDADDGWVSPVCSKECSV